MQSKKRLIRRMALAAGIVLVVAAAVALFTSVISSGAREERLQERRRQRVQAVEEARGYLAELAGRITSVPVDPTIVGEIQARYFEKVLEGRRFVWAVGDDGEFLFGVPREDFARLNTAWDTHTAAIVGEGAFVDRQDFLRQLIQESERLDLSDLSPNPDDPEDTPWADLRRYGARDDWMVFSTPLKTDNGSALGNLYLKMEDIEGRWEPWPSGPAEDILTMAGVASGLAGTLLWFLLPTWVYVDARERGVRRAMLWSFLVLISAVLGFVVYLIARPEEPTQLQCPGCGREVNGGAYCPHCGQDLAAAFCAACRYPLKPDWAFCPSCRTEIRTATADSAESAEGAPTAAKED